MKYGAIILFVLNIVLLTLQPKQVTTSQAPDLSAIIEAHDDPQFKSTLAMLLKHIRQTKDESGFVFLGDFLLRYGFCEEALPFYQEATRLDPNNYDAAIGTAVCLDQLGYLDAAINAYDVAIERADEAYYITEARQRQGELLMRLGRITEAQAIFEDMSYAPALVDLCRIYVFQKEYDKAKHCFDLLLESDPDNRSLEVYQLNALSSRHFGSYFRNINPTRQRELIYSENIAFEVRKKLAERSFGLRAHQLYKNHLNQLPIIEQDTVFFTEQELIAASRDPVHQAAGKALFAKATCIVCHGPDGAGITGPNLRDDFWIIRPVSASSIFITIRDGRANNTMPGFSQVLSPGQIRDLTAYVLHLHHTAERDDNGHSRGKDPQGIRQLLNTRP